MAEVRSVSVHLDADIASYVAKMKLAGAATDEAFGRSDRGIKATNTSLTTTERQLGKTDAAAKKLGADLDKNSNSLNRGSKEIDKYSGRLGVFADIALGLGPGLIPIAAEAVPLVTALGTNFLFAGAGAGTAVLAFHGVGAALKALNKEQLHPTAENLQAANLAMSALPPSAQAFTRELARMRPDLEALQRSAADGFLPGAQKGLVSLTGDLPIVQRGVHNISTELGHMAAQAGKSLSSDRWQPFLRFVGREAPTGLRLMGRSLGNVAHGAAELVMAFNPLTTDIDHGILNLTRDFDRWATSLGKTKGFQDFLDYLRANGPKVLDLLGATATTFIDISQAAAPLGGPVLDSLTSLLHIIDALANSDIGTPLILGVTAFRLLSRGEQLWASASKSSVGQFIAGQRSAVSAINSTVTAQQRATLSAEELAAAEGRTSAGWTTLGKGAAKAGFAAAGFALVASGATDQMGLTNTATLAMAGSLAGPWGAAVGGAIGLGLDYKASVDNMKQSNEEFTKSLDDLASGGHVHAIKQMDDAFRGFQESGKASGLVGQALSLALDQTDKAQKKAERSANAMTSAHHLAAAAAGDFGRAEQIAAQRTIALRKASDATAAKFLTLGNDVDKTKVSLNQWIHQLAGEARALENFGNNARSAADKGLRQGLIKQLEALGPAGALRMRQLANASQSEIAKANHAFASGRRAADDLAQSYAYISQHPANLYVNGVPQSLHEIRLVQSALAALRDKTIRVTTVRTTGGHSVAGNADGGTIPGPRAPYGDSVLRFLAPGEEVISNRRGQADRFRPLLKRINRMADGGTVDTHVTGSGSTLFASDSGLGAEATGAASGLRALRSSLRDSTRELDDERKKRQALAQQRQSLVSTVKSNFMSELFPTDNGIWGSASDPRQILRQDIHDAQRYRRDIRGLRRRGLSAGVLSTLDTLGEADAASGLSNSELRQVSRLYQMRQRAARSAGVTAGNAAFGDQLHESNQHLRELRGDVHRLTAQVKHLEKEQAKNAKATGDHVGKQINGTARTARRRGRPS